MNLRVAIAAILVLALGVTAAWFFQPGGGVPIPSLPREAASHSSESESGSIEGSLTVSEVPGIIGGLTAETPESAAATTAIEVSTGGGSIRGRVSDEKGGPVGGVVLHAVQPVSKEIFDMPLPMAPPLLVPELDDPEQRAESSDNGVFRIDGLAPGTYSLVARGQGFRQQQVDNLEVGKASSPQVDLRMVEGFAIEGIVFDANDKPVAGATVTSGSGTVDLGNGMRIALAMPGGRTGVESKTTTDASGRFRLDGLASGSHSLTARHEDWAPGDVANVAVGSRDLEIRLRQGATLAGIVLAPGGQPVPEVDVEIGGFSNPRSTTVTTDAQGRFRAEHLRPGSISLVVRSASYPSKPVRGLRVEDGESKTDLEIVLDPGATVTGLVLDPAGQPLAEAEVRFGVSDSPFFTGRHRVQTDAEGIFSISGLRLDRDYKGKVEHAKYLPTDIEPFVTAHDTVDLGQLSVLAGSRIRGVIRDEEGQAVAAAKVTVEQPGKRSHGAQIMAFQPGEMMLSGGRSNFPSTKSTETGTFDLAPLEAGEYTLTVRASGFPPYRSEPFTLEAESEREGVEIALPRGVFIAGQVVDGAGIPIAGAKVDALRQEPAPLRSSTTTDGEGQFRLEGLEEGAYRLTAKFGEFAPATVDALTGDEPVELVLLPKGAISGVVIDKATGKPVEEFRVRPERVNESGEMTFTEFSFGQGTPVKDPDGEFLLADLEPGTYRLEVRAKGFTVFEQENILVPAGEEVHVSVNMDLGGAIEGHVIDGLGKPIVGARVRPVREGRQTGMMFAVSLVASDDEDQHVSSITMDGEQGVTTDEEGYFLLDGLPPGETKISIAHAKFIDRELEKIDVVRAQTQSVSRVTLEKGGTIHGMVRDPQGNAFTRGNLMLTTLGEDGSPEGAPKFLNLDSDGKYSQAGLPEGTYQLKVHRWGGGGEMEIGFGGQPDAVVNLRADEEKRCNISLR